MTADVNQPRHGPAGHRSSLGLGVCAVGHSAQTGALQRPSFKDVTFWFLETGDKHTAPDWPEIFFA